MDVPMRRLPLWRTTLGLSLLLSAVLLGIWKDAPVAQAAVPTWIPHQVERVMLAQSEAPYLLPPGTSLSGSDLTLPGNLTLSGAATFSGAVTINGTLTSTASNNLTAVTASNFLVSSGIIYPRGNTVTDDNANTLTFNDSVADGASAVAFSFNSSNTLTTTAAVMEWKNNGSSKAKMLQDGYLASVTPHTLTSAYVNALLATGTTYGGHTVNKAFTVTDVTLYVSVGSSVTAANQVFTITDGTNTCTATFACNTVTNTTGAKTVAVANGSGTGCVYAASAALSFSLTTQGCGTAATVKNVDIVGKWQ
jgi:hypothetical protein